MNLTDVWLFGYGSLVWRPDFPFDEVRVATIAGWSRRFWQGSTDHRGVPGSPGRVVTLVEDPEAVCIGRAYLVDNANRAMVLRKLDFREKGGYSLRNIEVTFPENGGTKAGALVYIAGPDNSEWLGAALPDEIAEQISGSSGPSGNNDEYVKRLAGALRDIGAQDTHVFEIAALVSSLSSRRGEG
ncbi:MAG: gamma-glutamylcyclotransferase [Pseudomonadota bacterium]|nr:gamma-glutamylcyclotransferase [Pseudomonadota bacterium]